MLDSRALVGSSSSGSNALGHRGVARTWCVLVANPSLAAFLVGDVGGCRLAP